MPILPVLILLALLQSVDLSPASDLPAAAIVAEPSLAEPSLAEPSLAEHWRVDQRCGVNCSYVWLRHLGKAKGYEEVLNAFHVGENGSSLEDIREGFQSFGVAVRVIRCTPEWLINAPKPVIAHVEWESTTSSFEQRGHYVLVLGATGNEVNYLDGSSGVLTTIATQSFTRAWSGYCVAEVPQSGMMYALLGSLVVGTYLVFVQVRGIVAKQRKKDELPKIS